MTVITAIELNDFCPTGVGSRQAQGTHRCSGTRTHQSYLLDGWNEPTHSFREFNFTFRGCTKCSSSFRNLCETTQNISVRMSQDQGSPGSNKIDILLSIRVNDI